MNKLNIIVCILIASFVSSCSSSSDNKKLEEAIDAGKLKEAEELLKEEDDAGLCRYYGGLLIDEYLAIGKLDRAIYVFDNITGHNTMDNLVFGNEYSREYSRKIYNALLDAGRYDDAWNYHEREYSSVDYAGNAQHYLAYMTDVITSMCKTGRHEQVDEAVSK